MEENEYVIVCPDNGSVRSKAWCRESNGHSFEHRLDGPAYIQFYESGGIDLVVWYVDGICHREDGPAYISYYANGDYYRVEWYLCDEEYSKSEHGDLIALEKSIVSRDHAILNIRHESKFIRRRCQEVLDGV